MKTLNADAGGRRGRSCLFPILLATAVIGGSFWYVRQSRDRQQAIQEGVGSRLDWTARLIGGGITNIAGRVSSPEWDSSGAVSSLRSAVGAGLNRVSSGDRRFCYGGLPARGTGFEHGIDVLRNEGFVVGYCEERKGPAWVAYRLFRMDAPHTEIKTAPFAIDERTVAEVGPSGFRRSGYEMATLAPPRAIGSHYGQEAAAETYLMSNVLPMRQRLYKRLWRELESRAGRYAQRMEEVWVICGPVYGKGHNVLPSGVHVPVAFFAILVDDSDVNPPRSMAFVIEQEVSGVENVGRFLTSVAEIEKHTGLDFFPELHGDARYALERSVAPVVW